MDVQKVTKFGFECPACSEVHAPEKKIIAMVAWQLPEGEAEDGFTFTDEVEVLGQGDDRPGWSTEEPSKIQYFIDRPEKVKLFHYEEDSEDCYGTEAPSYKTAWECGKCETVYLDKDEAKNCCKDDEDEETASDDE